MIKVAIDTVPLTSGHSTRGMGVYVKRLIEHLPKSVDAFIFSESKSKLASYDVIHYPYFDLFYHTLPLQKSAKTVVTIPDVTPLLYPKYYPPGIKGKINFELQKRALKNVDKIITLSETSKKDIVRVLNIPEKKVTPIYLAPNFEVKKLKPTDLAKTKNKFKLPKEFVLYIGDVNWNKNLVRLIEAVKEVNTTLVIVGKSAVSTNYDKTHIENAPLLEMQEKYGDDKQIMRLGYLDDKDLNAVWQLATVYCMPSFYEGFGLSVVEAMSAGVPLVCSRTQALVEVAGDAAIYFDPYSVSDMAENIKKAMENIGLQKSLTENGKKRVKNFSWEKTAKETYKIYNSVYTDMLSTS